MLGRVALGDFFRTGIELILDQASYQRMDKYMTLNNQSREHPKWVAGVQP
jgi:hypothetical protein